jgi:hypothetical protein
LHQSHREEQLDSDLSDVEIGFEDDYIREGDPELLLNPRLVLGNRPTDQVRSHSELISNNACHGSSLDYTLLSRINIGKLSFGNLWHPQNYGRPVQVTIRAQQGSVDVECVLGAHRAMCSMHVPEDVQLWLQPGNGFQ